MYKIIRPFGTFLVTQPLIFKTMKVSTVTSANCALKVELVIVYMKLANYRTSAPESENPESSTRVWYVVRVLISVNFFTWSLYEFSI